MGPQAAKIKGNHNHEHETKTRADGPLEAVLEKDKSGLARLAEGTRGTPGSIFGSVLRRLPKSKQKLETSATNISKVCGLRMCTLPMLV